MNDKQTSIKEREYIYGKVVYMHMILISRSKYHMNT